MLHADSWMLTCSMLERARGDGDEIGVGLAAEAAHERGVPSLVE